MIATLLWIAASAACADGDPPRIITFGRSPGTGTLVNVAVEDRPFDPGLPTLVFVHGMNPVPRFVHFTMADRFGEAIARRGGPPVNVLGWDWNSATRVGLDPIANEEAAIRQGVRLAAALRALGADPGKLHLIGQSSGTIVVASAAFALRESTGRRLAQVTLLDPARVHHDTVFRVLDVGRSAAVVENAWASGPSGLGQPASDPDVRNFRVESPRSWSGLVNPRDSSHLNVVRWYLETAADPSQPWGFNASVFAAGRGPVEVRRLAPAAAPAQSRGIP